MSHIATLATLNMRRNSVRLRVVLIALALTANGSCFLDNQGDSYYGRIVVPKRQELRWSDGGLPRIFDPALAAASPDTDAVRAMYEGLTDYGAQDLKPVPGVAIRWNSSADYREWTFHLRADARWSNGDQVTAEDFVRSWQRAIQLVGNAPHAKLLRDLRGAAITDTTPSNLTSNLTGDKPPTNPAPVPQPSASQATADAKPTLRLVAKPTPDLTVKPTPDQIFHQQIPKSQSDPANQATAFGAEAIDARTLRVRLENPNPNFPALVAHPIFRPVHTSTQLTTSHATVESLSAPRGNIDTAQTVVSNGAFRLTEANSERVLLERASNYWNASSVKLERVRFIGTSNAEAALAAYRAGDIDAITNASFEPLALKLLAPYQDFHRNVFSALTYYSFNTRHRPFDNIKVREALAIAINRERLSRDQMSGTTIPATRFLPASLESSSNGGGGSDATQKAPTLKYDAARARRLLAEAGYPNGSGFPPIRLLVNRNEQQRQVAEAIAGMWRNALNITTELDIRSWAEYETALKQGDYDVARRSTVMQTLDEATNMRQILDLPMQAAEERGAQADRAIATLSGNLEDDVMREPVGTLSNAPPQQQQQENNEQIQPAEVDVTTDNPAWFLSEEQALRELPAFPIYFAASYQLVKPYVSGFNHNLLDAPLLKNVRINIAWQSPASRTVSVQFDGEKP